MHHYVMKVAYKGTHFLGWQKTKEGRSVQEVIESVLWKITQNPSITLQAASRTDRGVHATGQIVDFFLEKPLSDLTRLQTSLNQLLPVDVTCLDLLLAPCPSFHPTLSAIGKEYQYMVLLGKNPSPFHKESAWHVHHPLDLACMQQLIVHFCGTHDFYGFCNQRAGLCYPTTVRTMSHIALEHHKEAPWDLLRFTLRGDHFLYKMVRNIVGTTVWVGAGITPFQGALNALFMRDRTAAGITAPASGLTLTKVFYPQMLYQLEHSSC